MRSIRVLSIGVVTLGFLLGALEAALPLTAHAAWVSSGATQFQVGGALTTITPTNVGTTFAASPTCGTQGGTSLALVPTLLQGLKVTGVDPVVNPLALVVSCLDNGGSATIRSRLNFINPVDGKVIAQISTSTVPSTGYPHFVFRPDKGDLLGCGANGTLYSIAFLSATGTPLTAPTAQLTLASQVAQQVTSCTGLTWDAEADMIYVGLSVGGGTKIGRVVGFRQTSTTLVSDFTSLPCAANGLAISGGVLLMSCVPANNPQPTDATMFRLDRGTGFVLGVFGKGTAADSSFHPPAGLGDLACDPVTFHKDQNGRDVFTDGLWSRLGAAGNSVVALEFPAFTCGLPSNSVVVAGPYSPLVAGLSAPSVQSNPLPGALPKVGCFDATGNVLDTDGDGLPDCWETSGIDFDGDGTVDLQLCVQVNTNGDGVTLTQECADPLRKDLFAEIDYMQFHKPDPKALSQTQSVTSLKPDGTFVGVQSVREAFAAAPVLTAPPPPAAPTTGIRIHFQVDEQVTFFNFPVTSQDTSTSTSHVDQVAFTPCTGPATGALVNSQTGKTSVVDFDTVKAANFGTVSERANATALNAKRLAFRYVLFAHNLVGSPGGGSQGSGCSEVGGDDSIVTLGSFAQTSVDGVLHNRGTTDQQAGTFMHEFGHMLGFRHGGLDAVNCKPNYRSVMSYTRQFSGSPIPNRRLDYSRSLDPWFGTSDPRTGFLAKDALIEKNKLGTDLSLLAINPFFPSPDQIVFGPNAWSLVSPLTLPNGLDGINWNRTFTQGGKTPNYETTEVAANINAGATAGCDGSGPDSFLDGQDDWNNILYRASATLDFAGGRRTETPVEMTKQDETAFFNALDMDGKGIGDGVDCGIFLCTHRIDIKPSFPFPKTIDPGTEANLTIAIFSECSSLTASGICPTGAPVWNASKQVLLNDLVAHPLTFTVEPFKASVKVNNNGGGTCSISDVPDPITGKKDTVKDLKCQFPAGPAADGTTLPAGTHVGVVKGWFMVDPSKCTDLAADACQLSAFSARQEVTIVE
jgi:hypothetical protein